MFLCCKGRLGKNFDPSRWKAAEKEMAEAQGVRPVTDQELPEAAASVVVEGRNVFVCRKPCVTKIQKDPAKAPAAVDARLKKHAKAEAKTR